jgi:hypothetical protein
VLPHGAARVELVLLGVDAQERIVRHPAGQGQIPGVNWRCVEGVVQEMLWYEVKSQG